MRYFSQDQTLIVHGALMVGRVDDESFGCTWFDILCLVQVNSNQVQPKLSYYHSYLTTVSWARTIHRVESNCLHSKSSQPQKDLSNSFHYFMLHFGMHRSCPGACSPCSREYASFACLQDSPFYCERSYYRSFCFLP